MRIMVSGCNWAYSWAGEEKKNIYQYDKSLSTLQDSIAYQSSVRPEENLLNTYWVS